MSKRPLRSEIARKRVQGLFTGRHQELEDFRLNLELDYDQRRLIWMVTGQGGMGKTTLLRRFQAILSEKEYLTTWVDERNQPSVIAIMGSIADQIEQQGYSIEPFVQHYKTYLKLKKEIEADPERPSGFAGIIGRAGGKLGVELIKQLPVAGGITMGLIGEEVFVEKSGEIMDYLARRFGNKEDEVQLILDPIKELSPLFVESLTKITEKHPVALFFDTYENTADYLDDWLSDILSGRYGELDLQVLTIIAGRNSLGNNWLRDNIYTFLGTLNLEPLSELEAREFLTKRGVIDQTVTEVILKESQRVPVLLVTLSENAPNNLSKLGSPTGEAIDLFLKWIGDEQQREAVLVCSLPRIVNLDIVRLLLGEKYSHQLFDIIKRLPFVSHSMEGQWTYHEVVRTLMLRYRMQESKHYWQETHQKLADYYSTQRDAFNLEIETALYDERWQQINLEWLYHITAAIGRSAVSYWIESVIDSIEPGAPAEYDRKLAKTLKGIADALGDIELTNLSKKLSEGILAWNTRKFARTIPMLKILRDTSESLSSQKRAIVHKSLGIAFSQSGDSTAAIAEFTAAINLNARDETSHALRGQIYYELKDHDNALNDLNYALELNPYDGDTFHRRGHLHHDLKMYNEAIKDFTRAIELQSKYGNHYGCRAKAYFALKEFNKALTDLNQAIELRPKDPSNFYWRGRVYAELKKYPSAIEDFTNGSSLDSKASIFLYSRANMHYEMKEYNKALIDLNIAIDMDPENDEYIHQRAHVHQQLNSYDAAIEDFSCAITTRPDVSAHYICRGKLFNELEKFNEAISDFTQAHSLHPNNKEIFYARAYAHYESKKYDAALDDINRFIQYRRKAIEGYIARGNIFNALGQYRKAIEDFTKAINSQPKRITGYTERALTFFNLGEFEKGLEDLLQAHKLSPNNLAISFWLAIAWQLLGDSAKSQQTWKSFFEQIKSNTNSYLQLRFLAKQAMMIGEKTIADDLYNKVFVSCSRKDLFREHRELQLLKKLYPNHTHIEETLEKLTRTLSSSDSS